MNMLISIIILCYNSENTILETLDSVKEQDYENIELIINDDFSSDSSKEMINMWLSTNRYRFDNVLFIKNKKNIGTVKSINNCLEKIQGVYVKIFSADDILLHNAITTYVNYALKNTKIDLWFSKYKSFGERETVYGDNVNKFIKFSYAKQVRLSQEMNYIGSSIGMFVKSESLKRINYFDDDYDLLEDKPFYLRCIRNGLKMSYINEILVYYRIHESVSHGKSKYINERILEDHITFYRKEVEQSSNLLLKLHYLKDIYKSKLIIKMGNKKKYGYIFSVFDLLDVYYIKIIVAKLTHIVRTKLIDIGARV
jgi:glycosyltransferase involved in cell wall biosynthesis